MSHQYACPNCHECLGPNAREVPKKAYCSNCGETSYNYEGWVPCKVCGGECDPSECDTPKEAIK